MASNVHSSSAPVAAPVSAKPAPPIVAPVAAPGAFSAPAASVPVKTAKDDEEEDKCIICLDNVVSAKLKPCQHSVYCKACVEELLRRGDPCPVCRKPISGFDVGKWQGTLGEHGLWPTSLKNLMQLASGEGFNKS